MNDSKSHAGRTFGSNQRVAAAKFYFIARAHCGQRHARDLFILPVPRYVQNRGRRQPQAMQVIQTYKQVTANINRQQIEAFLNQITAYAMAHPEFQPVLKNMDGIRHPLRQPKLRRSRSNRNFKPQFGRNWIPEEF